MRLYRSPHVGSISVEEFGAVGDGVHNDAPAFQRAFNALAGTGVALWIPAGTYLHSSQVWGHGISNLEIIGSPGATILQRLTGAGDASAWAFNPTFDPTPIHMTAVNVCGSNVIQVASAVAVGEWIYAQNDATKLAMLAGLYQVLACTAAGGGKYNLTLDRPCIRQYGSKSGVYDTILVVESLCSNIQIWGNGMTFTGTSAAVSCGYIGMGTALNCIVADIHCDGSAGMVGAGSVAINFDLASFRCYVLRCTVDGRDPVTGNPTCVVGFGFQSTEQCHWSQCTASYCTSYGFLNYDSYACGCDESMAYECAPASASGGGLAFASNQSVAPGTTYSWARGCRFTACGVGIGYAAGSSYNVVDSCVFDYCGTYAVNVYNAGGLTPMVGNKLINCSILATQAFGAGQCAISVQGGGNSFYCSNLTTKNNMSWVFNVDAGEKVYVVGGSSTDDGQGTASLCGFAQVAAATSSLCVEHFHIKNTTRFDDTLHPATSCYAGTLALNDVVFEQTAATVYWPCVMASALAAATVILDNVRAIGNASGPWIGVLNNGAVASTFRIGPNCDFSQCGHDIEAAGSIIQVAQTRGGYLGIQTTGGNTTLSLAQLSYQLIEVRGTLGSDATVTPSPLGIGAAGIIPTLWLFRNNTTGAHNAGMSMASTINVAQGKSAWLRVNAAGDVERVTVDT